MKSHINSVLLKQRTQKLTSFSFHLEKKPNCILSFYCVFPAFYHSSKRVKTRVHATRQSKSAGELESKLKLEFSKNHSWKRSLQIIYYLLEAYIRTFRAKYVYYFNHSTNLTAFLILNVFLGSFIQFTSKEYNLKDQKEDFTQKTLPRISESVQKMSWETFTYTNYSKKMNSNCFKNIHFFDDCFFISFNPVYKLKQKQIFLGKADSFLFNELVIPSRYFFQLLPKIEKEKFIQNFSPSLLQAEQKLKGKKNLTVSNSRDFLNHDSNSKAVKTSEYKKDEIRFWNQFNILFPKLAIDSKLNTQNKAKWINLKSDDLTPKSISFSSRLNKFSQSNIEKKIKATAQWQIYFNELDDIPITLNSIFPISGTPSESKLLNRELDSQFSELSNFENPVSNPLQFDLTLQNRKKLPPLFQNSKFRDLWIDYSQISFKTKNSTEHKKEVEFKKDFSDLYLNYSKFLYQFKNTPQNSFSVAINDKIETRLKKREKEQKNNEAMKQGSLFSFLKLENPSQKVFDSVLQSSKSTLFFKKENFCQNYERENSFLNRNYLIGFINEENQISSSDHPVQKKASSKFLSLTNEQNQKEKELLSLFKTTPNYKSNHSSKSLQEVISKKNSVDFFLPFISGDQSQIEKIKSDIPKTEEDLIWIDELTELIKQPKDKKINRNGVQKTKGTKEEKKKNLKRKSKQTDEDKLKEKLKEENFQKQIQKGFFYFLSSRKFQYNINYYFSEVGKTVKEKGLFPKKAFLTSPINKEKEKPKELSLKSTPNQTSATTFHFQSNLSNQIEEIQFPALNNIEAKAQTNKWKKFIQKGLIMDPTWESSFETDVFNFQLNKVKNKEKLFLFDKKKFKKYYFLTQSDSNLNNSSSNFKAENYIFNSEIDEPIADVLTNLSLQFNPKSNNKTNNIFENHLGLASYLFNTSIKENSSSTWPFIDQSLFLSPLNLLKKQNSTEKENLSLLPSNLSKFNQRKVSGYLYPDSLKQTIKSNLKIPFKNSIFSFWTWSLPKFGSFDFSILNLSSKQDTKTMTNQTLKPKLQTKKHIETQKNNFLKDLQKPWGSQIRVFYPLTLEVPFYFNNSHYSQNTGFDFNNPSNSNLHLSKLVSCFQDRDAFLNSIELNNPALTKREFYFSKSIRGFKKSTLKEDEFTEKGQSKNESESTAFQSQEKKDPKLLIIKEAVLKRFQSAIKTKTKVKIEKKSLSSPIKKRRKSRRSKKNFRSNVLNSKYKWTYWLLYEEPEDDIFNEKKGIERWFLISTRFIKNKTLTFVNFSKKYLTVFRKPNLHFQHTVETQNIENINQLNEIRKITSFTNLNFEKKSPFSFYQNQLRDVYKNINQFENEKSIPPKNFSTSFIQSLGAPGSITKDFRSENSQMSFSSGFFPQTPPVIYRKKLSKRMKSDSFFFHFNGESKTDSFSYLFDNPLISKQKKQNKEQNEIIKQKKKTGEDFTRDQTSEAKTQMSWKKKFENQNKPSTNTKLFLEESIHFKTWTILNQLGVALIILKYLQILKTEYGEELTYFFQDYESLFDIFERELLKLLISKSEFRVIKNTKKSFNDVVGINSLLPEIGEQLIIPLKNSRRRFSKMKIKKPTRIYFEKSQFIQKSESSSIPQIETKTAPSNRFSTENQKFQYKNLKQKIHFPGLFSLKKFEEKQIKLTEKFQLKFEKLSPQKILLVGPPGTGKTLFVRALAGETKVPVIIEAGKMITANNMEMSGPKRLTQLFEEAREFGPCILFFDEVDTLGQKRDNILSSFSLKDKRKASRNPFALIYLQKSFDIKKQKSSLSELKSPFRYLLNPLLRFPIESRKNQKKRSELAPLEIQTLNDEIVQSQNQSQNLTLLTQFLCELDGINQNSEMIIIGATNRPATLDPALTRPGRFNKIIYLDFPEKQKRFELLKFYSRPLSQGISNFDSRFEKQEDLLKNSNVDFPMKTKPSGVFLQLDNIKEQIANLSNLKGKSKEKKQEKNKGIKEKKQNLNQTAKFFLSQDLENKHWDYFADQTNGLSSAHLEAIMNRSAFKVIFTYLTEERRKAFFPSFVSNSFNTSFSSKRKKSENELDYPFHFGGKPDQKVKQINNQALIEKDYFIEKSKFYLIQTPLNESTKTKNQKTIFLNPIFKNLKNQLIIQLLNGTNKSFNQKKIDSTELKLYPLVVEKIKPIQQKSPIFYFTPFVNEKEKKFSIEGTKPTHTFETIEYGIQTIGTLQPKIYFHSTWGKKVNKKFLGQGLINNSCFELFPKSKNKDGAIKNLNNYPLDNSFSENKELIQSLNPKALRNTDFYQKHSFSVKILIWFEKIRLLNTLKQEKTDPLFSTMLLDFIKKRRHVSKTFLKVQSLDRYIQRIVQNQSFGWILLMNSTCLIQNPLFLSSFQSFEPKNLNYIYYSLLNLTHWKKTSQVFSSRNFQTLFSWKNLNSRNQSWLFKDALFIKRSAYYLSGKAFLDLAIMNKKKPNQAFHLWTFSGTDQTRYKKPLNSEPFNSHFESFLLSCIAGKVSETLMLSNQSKVEKNNYSNIGMDELKEFGFFIELMIDNGAFSFQDQLTKKQVLINLMQNRIQTPQKQMERFLNRQTELFERQTKMVSSLSSNSLNLYNYLKWVEKPWWQFKLENTVSLVNEKSGEWSRLFLIDEHQRFRNSEWIAPDTYFHNQLNITKNQVDLTSFSFSEQAKNQKKPIKEMDSFLLLQEGKKGNEPQKMKKNFIEYEFAFKFGLFCHLNWNQFQLIEPESISFYFLFKFFNKVFYLLETNREFIDSSAYSLICRENIRPFEIRAIFKRYC